MSNIDFDITIVGGGVIGLSISYQISKLIPNIRILLLEKEKRTGLINSSRNTEVIHAGIYYQKDSMKSIFCKEGKNKIYKFCEKYKIKSKKIGKLFIDNSNNSIENLLMIQKQAKSNGLNDLFFIDKKNLREIEPNLNTNLALCSPSSGIFDTYDFISKLEALSLNREVTIVNECIFTNAIREGRFWKICTNHDENNYIKTKILINSAGLHSLDISKKIFNINFDLIKNYTKGCYLRYKGVSPFNHIIYPSLKPGIIEERVDATPDINGGLRFGPSAESPNNNINFETNKEILDKFYTKIKEYFPLVIKNKLIFDTVGIRPKVSSKKSKLPLDFKITCGNNFVDLVNIESPGLTSSLAIGSYIANHMKKVL